MDACLRWCRHACADPDACTHFDPCTGSDACADPFSRSHTGRLADRDSDQHSGACVPCSGTCPSQQPEGSREIGHSDKGCSAATSRGDASRASPNGVAASTSVI